MSIQRIDNPAGHTHGWQARWPMPDGSQRRWTRFFADESHGGHYRALVLAQREEAALQRKARRMRNSRDA